MSTRPQPTSAASMPSEYSSRKFSAIVAEVPSGVRNSPRWPLRPEASEDGISKIDFGAGPSSLLQFAPGRQPSSTSSSASSCGRNASTTLCGLPPMRPEISAAARRSSGSPMPALKGWKSGSAVPSGRALTSIVQPGARPAASALPVSRVRWSESATIRMCSASAQPLGASSPCAARYSRS